MLGFGLSWYPHHLFGFGRFEADTVALDGLIELLGREHHRPFEQPSVLHLLAALDVFPNGKRELRQQRKEAKQERKFVDVPERCRPRRRCSSGTRAVAYRGTAAPARDRERGVHAAAAAVESASGICLPPGAGVVPACTSALNGELRPSWCRRQRKAVGTCPSC